MNLYRLGADLLVTVHLAFIAWVLTGALWARWRPRLIWVHLPAVAWAAWIECSAGVCPLTPWEQELRMRAGQAGYTGGFVDHYLMPVIYPDGLTAGLQATLGAVLLVLNGLLYLWIWNEGRARS